jgi:hypothetical protein
LADRFRINAKQGIYDIEPLEKLREKGYNLFREITESASFSKDYMTSLNS